MGLHDLLCKQLASPDLALPHAGCPAVRAQSCWHHFANLLFHILGTLLLFGFLRYTTGRLWTGAFVAALFALHPAHVESVAWAAERKDVLSAAFWFATMWSYAFYARRPGVGRYAMVFILFALGLMAKPMLVTLPLVLLLLDWWPLERLAMNGRSVGRLAAEKLPLLIMAGAAAIITIVAQQEAIAGFSRLSFATRISNAFVSYCIYIGQALWPSDLAVFYPHPGIPLDAEALFGAMLLTTVTVATLRAGKQLKYLTTGWLWFLVTLVPVIGIVQVGDQAHADRYTYLPLVGLFIMAAWGTADIVKVKPAVKQAMVTAALIVVVIMGCITYMTTGYWKDDVSLFGHAAAVTRNNYQMKIKLGNALSAIGRDDEALKQLEGSLRIKPWGYTYSDIGALYQKKGQLEWALEYYQKALAMDPEIRSAVLNSGKTLLQFGKISGGAATPATDHGERPSLGSGILAPGPGAHRQRQAG